ncbi:hypothetical protein HYH02_005877 [Chlamydomonas schloesseri]|uniref:LysM domain-containing protein n=1 Tax=Chlamydomonas schloesseri TaxID=2026947 RepID=A0A835WK21_9CHLO|nr:hypothetical protein HYH02_005877 [Chlamydomonas schloesseri]|eukprot:KAG2449129.1 hypothetical protein HYH02_005877 [Chlamydomonas schloesseri]
MFGAATIPSTLLGSPDRGAPAAQSWSLGPLQLPFAFPGAVPSHAATPRDTGAAAAVSQFKEVVQQALQAPSSGRGGPASTSGKAPPRRVGMRVDYAPETPVLVGKRSISLRPRYLLPLSGAEPLYDDRDSRWFDVKEGALHGSYSWALQDYKAEREEAPVPGDVWRAEMPSEEEMPPVLTCKDLVKQVLVDQHGREDVVTPAFAEQACPAGSYKVMAFAAPVPEDDPAVNYCDHHFYVQHKDVNITLQKGDRLQDVANFFKLPVEELYDANPGLAQLLPAADRPAPRERSLLVRGANVWSHKPSEWLPPRLHDGAGRAIHNPMRAVAAYSDDEGGLNELPAVYCCSFCVVSGQARTGPQPQRPGGKQGAGQE